MMIFKKRFMAGLFLFSLLLTACEDGAKSNSQNGQTISNPPDNQGEEEKINSEEEEKEIDTSPAQNQHKNSGIKVPAYKHLEGPDDFYTQMEPNLLQPVSLNEAYKAYQSIDNDAQSVVQEELTELGFSDIQKLDHSSNQLNENELSLLYYVLTKTKNKQLQDWFNIGDKEGFIFTGLSEYSYDAVQVQQASEPETHEALFENYVEVEDPAIAGSPFFFISYLVRDGRVYQVHDPAANSTENITPFPYGIAPTRMILPYHVQKGTAWEQEVTIDGKTYSMISEITDKQDDEVRVSSFINGMEGYPNNRYEEEYIIKKGIGISYHYHTKHPDNMGNHFEFKYSHEQPVLIQ
ncbi:hypothetical protein GWK91_14315 [Virgibacillus sp. MSP4-1]|uniref:hypothetical protein n=1 Tax=Virgibacillus sp. MSP4-1 TaxID=2700081 RepID=UPI0005C49363|nr:hypothetical protein [Virgibacillus sp. MSP4-1]QHS24018.1 hypothetical protein GWK91_14315 [Virgibacillus sp. MSP4-1]